VKNSCLDNTSTNSVLTLKKSYYPLVKTPALPECEVCVIVPVRDEAELLEVCLKALACQVDFNGRPFSFDRYEVVLLVNNCRDDSAAIARQFSLNYPAFRLHVVERTLPAAEAYIGRVRQLLMDEAYYRLAGLGLAGAQKRIIASTDGDTQVSSTWIAATLLEISRGVDAVGGRIVADLVSCAALDACVKKRYLQGDLYYQLRVELETYLDAIPHDHWPRHAQHYGASLAVTAQMYRQAGGMPAVRTPEDVAFYRALLGVGARFRHSPLVQVTTSARQTVRTENGFAAQLNEWAAMGQQNQPFLVESAPAIETQLKVRRQLRNLWHRILDGYQHTAKDIASYANTLGINAQWLWGELTQPQTFELLFERIEAHQQQNELWQQQWPLVSLEQAIADLNTRLQKLRLQQSIGEAERFCHPSLASVEPGEVSL
jgi:hypothetical protein